MGNLKPWSPCIRPPEAALPLPVHHYDAVVAHFEVDGDQLVLRLTTEEHLEGIHRDLELPRDSVASARVTDDVWSELRGIRAPGTGIPGVVAVGTRRGGFGKDFAVVHGKGPGVVIELTGQDFERIVITVPDPEAEVARINAGRSGSGAGG